MKRNVILGCIWAFGWVLNACESGLDVPPVSTEFKPDGLVELGEKELGVWDLLGKSTPVQSEGEERIELALHYFQGNALSVPADSLYRFKADTLLTTPYFNVDKDDRIDFGHVLSNDVMYTRLDTLPLKRPEGSKISWQEEMADLEYVFMYTGFEYEVEMTLQNVFQRGKKEPVVIKETVDKFNRKGIRHEWKDFEFDIDLSGGNQLRMETKITIKKGSVVLEPQKVSLMLLFSNIKLQKAVGHFADVVLPLKDQKLKMDLDILENLENAFYMSDSKFYLVVKNKGIGVPMKAEDLVFMAKNADLTKSVGLKTQAEILFEGNPEDVVRTDSFAYTSENSNLSDFLKLPPHGIMDYSGNIHFLSGPDADEKVIYGDGLIQVDSYLDMPLVMKGTSLVFQDTLRNLDLQQWVLSSAKLTVASSTDLPFGMRLQRVDFYNAQHESVGKVEFDQELAKEEISADIALESLDSLSQASYGVAVIGVQPSLDILSVRQNSGLKIKYTLYVQLKK